MQDIATILLFQQFTTYLCAVLKHPATPAHAREWFNDAANEVANRVGFDCDKETLAAALYRAFGVNSPAQIATPEATGATCAPVAEPSLKTLLERQAALLGQIMAHPDANIAAVEWFNRLAVAIGEQAATVPDAQVRELKRRKNKKSKK